MATAKIRFKGTQPVEDAWLNMRLVLPKQVVDVPVEWVWNYTQSTLWDPGNKAAKDAHVAGKQARDERLRIEAGLPAQTEGEDA